ncbi:Tricarboxylate transport protein TctB [Marinobacterium lacunae]|uniref:Tricarboxylate transport protein TctB n=1 Tax=Marinobacterium lacunae TaxID=1232683 RepID=A0A081G4T8_9GAMM|nr:tripartite tricarboxylate transporter TctB family protein [Marinobacterium lacunae]KEA65793.1 Tricarboxylate transport protein TctB [Marinobacterium lacunae]
MPHSQHIYTKPGETLFGFLMVILSVYLFWQAYSIAGFESLSSPGAFPLAATALMVITSCIACVQNLRLPSEVQGHFFKEILPPVVALMIAVILIFAVVLDTLGFIPTALAFLFLTIKFLHRGGLLRTALLSLMVLTLIYVVFRLVFKVVLPEGIVPEREILAYLSDLFNSGAQ